MTTLLIALFVVFAVGFAAWRVVVARRAPNRIADTEIAPPAAVPTAPEAADRTPEQEAARATARAKAERVIAAEAARRKAAIQKAQNVARADAERRAADAARTAASLVSTLPATQLPPAPVVAPVAAQPAVVERTVPLARPAPVAAPSAPAVATVLKTAAQTLVMLVDDSKMVRVKSSRLLASHDFQVVTAVDGIDALKQLENCCPDLLITDVDMPGMDGFGLVAALKGDARTRQIPLVMITSAEDRHREEALRVGVGLVMGKPYDEAALIAHIRSFKFFAKAEEAEALACA
ncbi:MAG: PleD family two-component system response regulator [Vitreoscilla sp.]